MMDHTNESAPPFAQVIQMALGYVVSRAVHACAKLGFADQLISGPRSSDDLAKACGTHPDATYRLLRTMSSIGLFSEGPRGRFSLTPLGESLKTGAPGAARSTVLSLAGDTFWATWGQFEHALRTGLPGAEKALGMGMFDYFAGHPVEAGWFNDAMIGVHGQEPAAVAKASSFADLGTLVDVGGGTGNLIGTILQANPRLRGTIYDLPHVAGPARARLASLGLSARCDVVAGSFFDSVPMGDAYILSHIIHDWPEDKCVRILENCRRGNPKAKVMLVEMVIPPGNDPHPGKILDLVMLNIPGGKERTADEYGELFAKAGYRLARVVPTESPVSVIEAVPAR
jgi:hypothetical protein